MKAKLFFCIVATATLSTVALANQIGPTPNMVEITSNIGHKINGYKYLCMEQQGNLHDLEDKFNSFFAELGFTIITPDDEEELSEEERLYVLYGSYVYNTVPNGLDNMTLTLRNSNGKIVFSSTKEAACFVSVKRCANKASDKIINQIKDLNYSFDPTLVQNKKKTEIDAPKDTEKEEMIKMARDMKADGMSVDKIIKYTGLTEEEVNKL